MTQVNNVNLALLVAKVFMHNKEFRDKYATDVEKELCGILDVKSIEEVNDIKKIRESQLDPIEYQNYLASQSKLPGWL